MNYILLAFYRWKELTPDGRLYSPTDDWDYSHHLSQEYESREAAVNDYERYVLNGYDCPTTMVLIEEYRKVIDWDE